jgi:hypothetical protein
MNKTIRTTCAALLLLGATASLKATTITYDLTSLGGNQWKYEYTVANDFLSDPLSDFVIFFPDVTSPDALSYTLNNIISPPGWTPMVTQPSAIGLGGMAEWFGSIPVGGSLGGFGFEFAYSGSSPLGSQYFEVYDANFDLADRGLTVPGGPHGAPEQSATIIYMLLGMLSLAGMRYRDTMNGK